MKDTFETRRTLDVGGVTYHIRSLPALRDQGYDLEKLSFAHKILLENLLRHEDGEAVTTDDIECLAAWDPGKEIQQEIAFTPARVLLQDFTGVPAVVDLAAMRDAMRDMGGDPEKINPISPAELVIDHSVQVDEYGSAAAFLINAEREFERNRERYAFLKWGQKAFDNFKVVPPDTGIVHQVNLEYLGRVVMPGEENGEKAAWPDTLVGTDSHTTMINGLGILGWGVGGIEAEAAMLGQAVSMLIPQVVGFRLTGRLAEGTTATDLVLRVTQMLRERGVVGKFVEFFGPGLEHMPLADRATIANMAPEYGATCGLFPVDGVTLEYLRFTGRDEDQVRLVEAYMKEQGLFHTADTAEAAYSDTLELDMGSVEPSLAGPKRPQDRVAMSDLKATFRQALEAELKHVPVPGPAEETVGRWEGEGGDGADARSDEPRSRSGVSVTYRDTDFHLDHGAVVIAAITSCTNTSNPSVMIAAGLVARNAVARGLQVQPWVKTSLAPGSKVVSDYLEASGLMDDLEALRFHLVGYGCTTCIGNSGPLPEPIEKAVQEGNLVVASVLSGNRNFEGRIHSDVRTNWLASPPLVVAYALAGTVDIDLKTDPLGEDADGNPVYLKDIWPSRQEVDKAVRASIQTEMFQKTYADVFSGDERWRDLQVTGGETYDWDPESTYVKLPPYFVGMPAEPPAVQDIQGARALAVFGDSITTDHISPAGAIHPESPAGRYLQDLGVEPRDFNTYGSRRGNHEVMMRGTFANVRIKNRMVPGVEGGYTKHLPDGEQMSIYDAAMRYRDEGVPLIVLAGKEYGTGSSRDWAAKGPALQGLRAAIAQSYERIHRSNLIGMGVLPLEFQPEESAETLGLTGEEVYTIEGLAEGFAGGFEDGKTVHIRADRDEGPPVEFTAKVRLDTPQEMHYYRHGGILSYVLRTLSS